MAGDMAPTGDNGLCWPKFQYRSASDVVQVGRSSCRAKLALA